MFGKENWIETTGRLVRSIAQSHKGDPALRDSADEQRFYPVYAYEVDGMTYEFMSSQYITNEITSLNYSSGLEVGAKPMELFPVSRILYYRKNKPEKCREK